MNSTRVAGEVFVVDGAGEEVSDCFLPTVRVVREAGAGVDGEVVEHEEGGERRVGVPMERRTVAPAPSDWERARKEEARVRGVIFGAGEWEGGREE